MAFDKKIQREKRHRRVRKKVYGLTDRPRLSVSRSLNNIVAQIIDDTEGRTLVSASSLARDFTTGHEGHCGNRKAAMKVGELVARKALDKGIKKVVLDRGGHKYHGRVAALADAARKAGLEL